MKNIVLKAFLAIAIIVAMGFEVTHQFIDFEAKNYNGINVATSSIQDKIIVLHTISSKSISYKKDLSVYKELQGIYQKAFFDRYAKKGLVVITITDKILDNTILPNSDFTFLLNDKTIKSILKKYNLNKNGGNIIVNGKREIVHSNIPTEKIKSMVASLLTRDRAAINYFE
ncbi:MAG: hypothetical protein ACK4IK_05530 [Bacteroidia bacterium]